MSIAMNQKKSIFLLNTRSSSYAFGIDNQGLVRHLYWGGKIESIEDFEMPVLTEISTNDPVSRLPEKSFRCMEACVTRNIVSRLHLQVGQEKLYISIADMTSFRQKLMRNW